MAIDKSNIQWDATQVYKYKYGNTFIPIFVTPYQGEFKKDEYVFIADTDLTVSQADYFNSTIANFGLVSVSGYSTSTAFQYSDGKITFGDAVMTSGYWAQPITINTGTVEHTTRIYVDNYSALPPDGTTMAGCFVIALLQDTTGRLIGEDFLSDNICPVYSYDKSLGGSPTIEGLDKNTKGTISGIYRLNWHPRQYRTNSDTNIMNMWSSFYGSLIGNSKLYDENNPYGGGEEQEEPGEGSFDYSSDDVPVPELPEVSVTDSGFVRLFAPTASELQALGHFMWSDAFSLDTFKKLFADPMDCIIGLSIVPVKLPTGGQRSITVGNIVSTVSCTICTSQYVKVKCGSFKFSKNAFTGSYLDYSPYTKCYLYLPYIGTQQIDIDEFMGSTMSVEYHVDILTGAMFCFVSTTKGSGGSKLVYTFAGQCAENVPLSSTSYGNTIASILQAASSIGAVAATAATGGAAAPIAAGMLANATTATANAATSMKPNIQHSGSVAGGSGIMGCRYPYLIFEAPWLVPVTGQQNYTGYASGKVVKLSSLSGFATIEAINLSVKGATDTELREIKQILQEGVIL